MDEYRGPIDFYKKEGIAQLYIPTVDHFSPSVEDIHKSIKFINEYHSKGEGVYIHCKSKIDIRYIYIYIL